MRSKLDILPILARRAASDEGYAVHVKRAGGSYCGGECTQRGAGAAPYWCHKCDMPVALENVATPSDAVGMAHQDIAHLLHEVQLCRGLLDHIEHSTARHFGDRIEREE